MRPSIMRSKDHNSKSHIDLMIEIYVAYGQIGVSKRQVIDLVNSIHIHGNVNSEDIFIMLVDLRNLGLMKSYDDKFRGEELFSLTNLGVEVINDPIHENNFSEIRKCFKKVYITSHRTD